MLGFPVEVLRAETMEEPKAAGGIRTEFGDVLIENLDIGKTYNLRDIAGIPFKITNTGLWTIQLRIDPEIPDEKVMREGFREAGYQPVPSIDWISLAQNQFLVPSGESALTDVLLTIPNDPTLYNKRFMVRIFSRSTDERFLNLGVFSNLFITIVPSAADAAKRKDNRSRGIVENMDYTIIPDKLVILNAPMGRKMDVRKEINKTIKLANSGVKPVDLRIKSVSVGSTPLTVQRGYEIPADVNWLKTEKKVFTVEADSFADPGLVLELPADPALLGKKLMFVLKVEPADPDIVGVTYYAKIYVEVVNK